MRTKRELAPLPFPRPPIECKGCSHPPVKSPSVPLVCPTISHPIPSLLLATMALATHAYCSSAGAGIIKRRADTSNSAHHLARCRPLRKPFLSSPPALPSAAALRKPSCGICRANFLDVAWGVTGDVSAQVHGFMSALAHTACIDLLVISLWISTSTVTLMSTSM